MTSRLSILKSQLAGLGQARRRVRAVTAWSALAIAVLAALAAFFALDLVFELAVPQRVVVFVAAAAAVGWAYWRFTRPFLGIREDEIEMALLVEKQQRINNDLVAALQFELPQAERWGSRQLSAAVVDYVAAVSSGINPFEGFSKEQMQRRLGILATGIAAALLISAAWPGHVSALANRLFLGSRHYPTRTRIEQVVINRAPVLVSSFSETAPGDCKQPQGRPVTFLVQCAGELPTSGTIHLAAADSSRSRTRLALKPLSLDERRARLEAALRGVQDASEEMRALSPPERDELRTLLAFDAPQVIPSLEAAKEDADLSAVASAISAALGAWPGEKGRTALLMGELGRLNESLTYKLYLGDAWTDAAAIRMIPLPIVELRITPTPPAYAREGVATTDSSGRQLAVLEGSSIDLAIECVNRKRIEKAWLTVQGKGTPQQVELAPQDGTKLAWAARGAAPLRQIREEFRYEIQVIDEDGLSLEMPIRGTIRIRPDRPPSGVASVIHKVVLPSASPLVDYRASDDHDLSRVALILDVERGAAKSPAAPPAASPPGAASSSSETNLAPAAIVPTETHRYDLFTRDKARGEEAVFGGGITGFYTLSLSPLKLAKGDRLKLTLEVTDYRGENERGEPNGVAQQSDPLVLEISDEAGVLAAISEADPRSEERLTEIIKRQLGIGESP